MRADVISNPSLHQPAWATGSDRPVARQDGRCSFRSSASLPTHLSAARAHTRARGLPSPGRGLAALAGPGSPMHTPGLLLTHGAAGADSPSRPPHAPGSVPAWPAGAWVVAPDPVWLSGATAGTYGSDGNSVSPKGGRGLRHSAPRGHNGPLSWEFVARRAFPFPAAGHYHQVSNVRTGCDKSQGTEGEVANQKRITERAFDPLLDAQAALDELRVAWQRVAASGFVTTRDLRDLDQRFGAVAGLLRSAAAALEEADLATLWAAAHLHGGIGPWHLRLAREHGRRVVIALPGPDDPDAEPLVGLLREAA